MRWLCMKSILHIALQHSTYLPPPLLCNMAFPVLYCITLSPLSAPNGTDLPPTSMFSTTSHSSFPNSAASHTPTHYPASPQLKLPITRPSFRRKCITISTTFIQTVTLFWHWHGYPYDTGHSFLEEVPLVTLGCMFYLHADLFAL